MHCLLSCLLRLPFLSYISNGLRIVCRALHALLLALSLAFAFSVLYLPLCVLYLQCCVVLCMNCLLPFVFGDCLICLTFAFVLRLRVVLCMQCLLPCLLQLTCLSTNCHCVAVVCWARMQWFSFSTCLIFCNLCLSFVLCVGLLYITLLFSFCLVPLVFCIFCIFCCVLYLRTCAEN